MFEIDAASGIQEQINQQQALDKLAAAAYDVRERFGEFLFQAASVEEFRDRVALVKNDAMKVIDKHLMPVTGVVRRVMGRNSELEKEFRSQLGVLKGAPDSGNTDDGRLHGPFAGYDDWEDCTSKNSDKGDPDAYCGQIYHQVEEGRKDKGEPLTDFQDKQSRRRRAQGAGGIDDETFHTGETPGNIGMDPGSASPSATGLQDQTLRSAHRVAYEDSGPTRALWRGKPVKPQNDKGYHPHGDEWERVPNAGYPLDEEGREITSEDRHDPEWENVLHERQRREKAKKPPRPQPRDHGEQYFRDQTRRSQKTATVVPGDRVELHPATDAWMSGDRYGEVQHVTPTHAHVLMDRSGKTRKIPHEMYRYVDKHGEKDVYGRRTARPFADFRDAIDEDRPFTPEEEEASARQYRERPPIHFDPRAARRRQAEEEGRPLLDTDETFEDHQGEELEPEGDFKGYLSDVDQGAPEKIDDNFVDNPDAREHTENPATSGDFAKASSVYRQFVAFCRHNRLPLHLGTLERHGRRLSDRDYLIIARQMQAETYQGEGDVEKKSGPFAGPHGSFPVGTPEDLDHAKDVCNMPSVKSKHPGTCESIEKRQKPARRQKDRGSSRRRTAQPDYLQKADEALTNLLNQRAEQFQEEVAPFQQALQTVQQAEQAVQAQNPLQVQPPAGTVNVLPDQGGQGADQGMPPADQGAPPPAAAEQGGLPPDQGAMPPQVAGKQRKRGGQGKGKARRRRADSRQDRHGGVIDHFQNWLKQRGELGRGGWPDIEAWANENNIGERGKSMVHQHLYGPQTTQPTAGRHDAPPSSLTDEDRYQQWAAEQGRDPDDWDTFIHHQFQPGRHEGRRKQAWQGWGPVPQNDHRRVAGWDWNDYLNAYTAGAPARFACECGEAFDIPSGFHTCRCGKQWNSCVIGSGGANHEASAEQYLVREIPVRPGVVVANRRSKFVGYDEDDDFDDDRPPERKRNRFQDDAWRNRGIDDDQLGNAVIRHHGVDLAQYGLDPGTLHDYGPTFQALADHITGLGHEYSGHLNDLYHDVHHVYHNYGKDWANQAKDWTDRHVRQFGKPPSTEDLVSHARDFLEQHPGLVQVHASRRHRAAHPPLSGKASCQHCWNESQERGASNTPYLDLLKSRHHSELTHQFHQDRYLEQQRQNAKPRGPGRRRDRAAGYADEHPEAFPYEHLKPGEDPFADRPRFPKQHPPPEYLPHEDEDYDRVARRKRRRAAGDHEAIEGEEEEPFNNPPHRVPTFATPDDWHRRDPKGKWTPKSPGPRKRHRTMS
jgi:hypothetical protein